MRISDWSSDVCSSDLILPPAPVHRPAGSTGLAEREIDPLRAQQRMLAVLERQYAVMAQPVHAAPDDDVAVREWHARGLVRTRRPAEQERRSEEHTSELPSLMRISYAVFCLKKKTRQKIITI